MDNANYSKPTQREIDRAETDLLITLSQLTGRQFAELAGWHETKVSRMNWRDIATIFCIARMAVEVSPIGRAIQDAYQAIGNKKAPVTAEGCEKQISISF
ncbi:regulatory protein [bacteria symbiont BFo1 of Frankliniella occidentalis]|nr:regulatory protein [bacteria symbiont BFo1 of Frankliniella occidentalis]KYP84491.1 regulatory protein [bacteria symbiont BFo1 of Frankliniella occidentalis]